MSAYSPPYKLTENILSAVALIAEQLGKLDSGRNGHLSPRLRRDNRIKSIHSSLAIENNSLTLSQVTDVIDGKRVLGPPNEIHEVTNAFAAYNLLPSLNPYSIDDLLNAHKTLMSGLIHEAGVFRSGGVGVFSGETLVHMGTPAQFVYGQIADLFEWCSTSDLHPLVKSCIFHCEFELIHPFADGNGRVGRLWQTLLLSRWKSVLGWIPVESMIEKEQSGYYAALGAAGKTGDDTIFIEFMLQLIKNTIADVIHHQRYTPESDTVNDTANDTLNLSDKENKILAIIRKNNSVTIQQLVTKTGYSRSTVLRVVSSLKQKDLLMREGSDKTGHWVVKE